MSEEEKVISEIIERYGEEINLRRSPYIIVEIIRTYHGRLGPGLGAECLPPGGPPKRGVSEE